MLDSYAEFCRKIGICRTCEHFKPGRLDRCAKCGCVLEIKLRLAAASCPENKF